MSEVGQDAQQQMPKLWPEWVTADWVAVTFPVWPSSHTNLYRWRETLRRWRLSDALRWPHGWKMSPSTGGKNAYEYKLPKVVSLIIQTRKDSFASQQVFLNYRPQLQGVIDQFKPPSVE